MKVLALDLGERRVGYAVGRTESGFVGRTGFVELSELSSLLKDTRADLVLVGLPVSLSGHFSHAVERTLDQIDGWVSPYVDEIAMIDERYTSKMVERGMSIGDRRNKKGRIDALSAFTILEDYLRGNPKVWRYRKDLDFKELRLDSKVEKILVWELPMIVECESAEIYHFASHPQVFVGLKRLGLKVTNRESDLLEYAPFELVVCEDPEEIGKVGIEFQEVMTPRGGLHPREGG